MEIDHFVLAVSNLAASVAHYDRLFPILGFRKSRDHVWTNEQQIFIELRLARDPSRAYVRQGVGLNHLGVRATSRAHVDELVASLRAVGVDAPAPTTIEEAYVCFVPDPDGVRIEIGYEPPR
jgi:catechol 2,3-dioxygenase-like lactoylglutathione lyase family enzyme